MKLYLSALNLPESLPDTIESTFSNHAPICRIRLDKQILTLYWEIFDPTVQAEPICGNLIDDLLDIAVDLRKGMTEYEAEKFGNACFEWRVGFLSHWGNHTVNALRMLHSIRNRESGNNYAADTITNGIGGNFILFLVILAVLAADVRRCHS